jgi:hypothetical protein
LDGSAGGVLGASARSPQRAYAALKSDSGFLTFNVDDFQRLATGDRPKIVMPPDPPSADVTA